MLTMQRCFKLWFLTLCDAHRDENIKIKVQKTLKTQFPVDKLFNDGIM